MILDAVKVNSLVIPNLAKTKTNLEESYKISNTLLNKLPSSASSRNRLSEITKRINTAGKNINTITIKLDNKLEKAKTIEKKNKAKTTAISAAVGAVAGAAGAAIGVATGGIKGAVVGGAIGAAAGVAVAKSNVISSVGKALKNTGAKIAKNVGNFFKSIGNGLKKIGKSIVNACKKIANKVVSFVKEKIAPVINKILNVAWKGIKFLGRCAATVVNLAVSLVEGVVSLVEALGDVVLIVAGAVATAVAAVGAAVYWAFTGKWELGKWSGAIWKKWCLPWVGYDWTSKWAFSWASGSFIDNAAFSWAKRDGGLGYKIGKGVGYVVGIIALTAVTAGGGTAAVGAASAASAAGASTASAVGAGAAAFVSSATAAVGTSTLIAGTAKFGAEMQKGYNSLGLEPGQEISTADAWKLVGSSAVKGVVEAGTWYVTYGGGAKNMAGATKAAVEAGAKVTLKTKAVTAVGKAFSGASKTWWKAGMQATKEFVNEGANTILTGEYDVQKAITNAVVSAGTSVLYDKSIGKWLGDADKGHKATYAEAKKAAEQASVDDTVAAEVLDSVDDNAAAAASEASKDAGKKAAKDAFDLDYYMNSSTKEKLLNLSQEAGGKKAFGKGVKDLYKEGIKIPVNGIADAIVGAQ